MGYLVYIYINTYRCQCLICGSDFGVAGSGVFNRCLIMVYTFEPGAWCGKFNRYLLCLIYILFMYVITRWFELQSCFGFGDGGALGKCYRGPVSTLFAHRAFIFH